MVSDRSGDASSERRAAQRRLNRVAQFRDELAALEGEQALLLTADQRARLEAHLEHLTADLVREHGIDATESARRMSWGIRLTALLGGAAVLAALVLLLHRVWGFLPPVLHATLLTALPLVFLAGAVSSRRRRLDSFFTTLLALAAGAAFIMGLSAMGTVYNQPGSPQALLAWALFALGVGWGLNVRLLLVAGLILLCTYTAAVGLVIAGGSWTSWVEHPAYMIPTAGLLYAVPGWFLRSDAGRYGVLLRACGAGGGLSALLLLSLTGHVCCLGVSMATAETVIQLAGLGLATAVVCHGVRLGEASVANLGAMAFGVFLFVRLHAWCWAWMPKYMFFFMLALIAVVLLLVFRRLRLRGLERSLP